MKWLSFLLPLVVCLVGCQNGESTLDPVQPSPNGENPDTLLVILPDRVLYEVPAEVRLSVRNGSSETLWWWNQCHPSFETLHGGRWVSAQELICTGDGPTAISPGASWNFGLRLYTPGVYRATTDISHEIDSGVVRYHSLTWTVE